MTFYSTNFTIIRLALKSLNSLWTAFLLLLYIEKLNLFSGAFKICNYVSTNVTLPTSRNPCSRHDHDTK